MEFIHGDIMDKELVDKHFKDADIVHHLAGITDVPRTISEASTAQDEKIKEVALDMRWMGQEHTITLKIDHSNGKINLDAETLKQNFMKEYENQKILLAHTIQNAQVHQQKI